MAVVDAYRLPIAVGRASIMSTELDADVARVGMLLGEFGAVEYVACMLVQKTGAMPIVSVPFFYEGDEFVAISRWGSSGSLPSFALYVDDQGPLTLSGLRWKSTRNGSHVGRVAFDSNIAILGRPREEREIYAARQFTSYIDGLEEATHFRTIDNNVDSRPNGEPIAVTIRELDEIEWTMNGFIYSIGVHSPWSSTWGQSFEVRTRVFLRTQVEQGATVEDHLQAHWPIRALLVFLFGSQLAWREHRISDDQFPVWMNDGPSEVPDYTEVYARRTIKDFALPAPSRNDLGLPLVYLEQIGAEALASWVQLYQDPDLARAVQPGVEVLNGLSNFLEPQLMMAAISLDAFGYVKRGRRQGDLWQNILVCIEASGIDLSSLGTPVEVAKALANVNNDLKHPDRGNRPSSLILNIAVRLCKALLRMQLFDILALNDDLKSEARRSADVGGVPPLFRRNGIGLDCFVERGRNVWRFVEVEVASRQ